MRSGPEGERGAVALLTAVGAAGVMVVTVAVLVTAADLSATAARARTAADAAALAAMAASPLAGGGDDPCAAAARLTDANGAGLARCSAIDHPHWPLRVEVSVSVTPAGRLARFVLPRLHAQSAAGLRPAPRPRDSPRR